MSSFETAKALLLDQRASHRRAMSRLNPVASGGNVLPLTGMTFVCHSLSAFKRGVFFANAPGVLRRSDLE